MTTIGSAIIEGQNRANKDKQMINDTNRMIELYKEVLAGYKHEVLTGDYWIPANPDEGFSVLFEYRKIEKPQTLDEAAHKHYIKCKDEGRRSTIYPQWDFRAGARWALKTGWKGDE